MSNNVQPLHKGYVTPAFGEAEVPAVPAGIDPRVRRPIRIGAAVIGSAVLGLGLWASVTPISSGINAPGELRVEANRKTLRHREGGTVREILVKEGTRVEAGQVLLRFDDVQPKAGVDINQNAVDVSLAQAARYEAEALDRGSITFPKEITSRAGDPRVAQMMRDQEFLFSSRRALFESQRAVLGQRLEQQASAIQGLQAQVTAVNEQSRLTQEQLSGYQTLYEKGFASKNLILRYQASMAELAGRKGQLVADIARMREQQGETRMQLSSLSNQRQSEAADGMREMQARIADAVPKLTASQQMLKGTVIRSPVDGFVFNLSQFTVGGVAVPGEALMDVVPDDSHLVVTTMVRPQDVDQVKVGMDAKVRLSGLNQRWTTPLPAKVVTVSADRIENEKSGQSYFRADLSIDPKDLTHLPKGLKLTPGMPADAMIVTGKRTVMGFLISPLTDTIHDAFRED